MLGPTSGLRVHKLYLYGLTELIILKTGYVVREIVKQLRHLLYVHLIPVQYLASQPIRDNP